jgi:hypothetical protein
MWVRIWEELSTVSIKLAGDFYVSHHRGPTSMLLGAPALYWGRNATEKEGKGAQQLQFLRI